MSRKKLAWANKEVETFVCILGEEDVVYDVYVAAAAIDIRPTTKVEMIWKSSSTNDLAVSRDQCESVASSVESMLEDAQHVQTQCRTCSNQLALSATQLRMELAALRQQAETVQLDIMARVRRQLDQLMDIEAAFDASERTARKLRKLL
ncbi:unnamed protein product [Boreogadus saida]